MQSKAEQYRQACEAMMKADEDRPKLQLAVVRYTVTKEGGLYHGGATLLPGHIPALIRWLRDTFEPPADDPVETGKGVRDLPNLPELVTEEIEERLSTRYRLNLGESERIVANAYRDGAAEYKRLVEAHNTTQTRPDPEVAELTEEEAATYWTTIYQSGESLWHLVMIREVYRAGAEEMNKRWREREGQ